MSKSPPIVQVNHIGVGIDTARYGHHVSFLREDKQPAAKPLAVKESTEGYQQLRDRLEQLHKKHPQAVFHVHLDAAGQYAINLEHFLRSIPLPTVISVGEPKRNKDYHKAVSPKRSSDSTESYAMARFAVVEQPPPTPAVSAPFYVLRETTSRLQGYVRDTTRAINRLHNLMARVFPELAAEIDDLAPKSILNLLRKFPTPQRIAAARLKSLEKIPYLRKEKAALIQKAAQKSVGSLQGELAELLVRQEVENLQQCQNAQENAEKLLLQAYDALPTSAHVQVESIGGIGKVTAAVLVAKIVSIDRFPSAEHLVGYFGVFPEEESSGVERDGTPRAVRQAHMSRKGSDVVRRYLWNAANSAIQRNNPAVQGLYARLRAKGTRGDVALGHCMRKLLHQVFGVWQSNQPFDPDYETRRPPEKESSQPSGDPEQDTPLETEAAATQELDHRLKSRNESSEPPQQESISQTPSAPDLDQGGPSETEPTAGHALPPENGCSEPSADPEQDAPLETEAPAGHHLDHRLESIQPPRATSQPGAEPERNAPSETEAATARKLDQPQNESSEAPAHLDQDGPSQTEAAAGHTRDILPQKEVVTAATSNVEATVASVNRSTHATESPGSIDYKFLLSQISMERILGHLGHLDQLRGSGPQRKGPCPLHNSRSPNSRTFSVNFTKNVYCCHSPRCSRGDMLDFWRHLQNLPHYEAALHLADTFNLELKPEQSKRRGTSNLESKAPEKLTKN